MRNAFAMSSMRDGSGSRLRLEPPFLTIGLSLRCWRREQHTYVPRSRHQSLSQLLFWAIQYHPVKSIQRSGTGTGQELRHDLEMTIYRYAPEAESDFGGAAGEVMSLTCSQSRRFRKAIFWRLFQPHKNIADVLPDHSVLTCSSMKT